jgi:nitrogen fixation protein
LLNTFRFSIEGIDEWVGLSGIKVKSQIEKPTVSITYSQPEDISLNLKNGMNLLITFYPALSGYPNTTEAKITQKTYFKLVSEQERPLKTLPQQLIKLLPSSVLLSIKPSV